MISEGIAAVKGLVEKAFDPKIVQVPGKPPHLIYLAGKDGALIANEIPSGARYIPLLTIEDLCAMANQHFDTAVREGKRLAIFYDSGSVDLIFDFANGRERAQVKLHTTDEYKFFEARAQSPLIEVKDFRQALRFTLRKCYADAKIIEQVSSLGATTIAGGKTTVARGAESFSKEVQQQVAEPDSLPDPYQTFSVRKYANPDLDVRAPIQFAIDPDLDTRRWFVKPLQDSMIAFDQGIVDIIGARIRQAVKEAGVPVYQGAYTQKTPG